MKSNEKRLPFSTPTRQHGSNGGGSGGSGSGRDSGESTFSTSKFTSFLSSFAGSNNSNQQQNTEQEKEATAAGQGKYTKEMIEKMEEDLNIANMRIEEMESQFQTQRDIFKQSTRALADENERLNKKVTELEKKLTEPKGNEKGDPSRTNSAAPEEEGESEGSVAVAAPEAKKDEGQKKDMVKEGEGEEEENERKKEESDNGNEEQKQEHEGNNKQKGEAVKDKAEQTSNESLIQLSAMLREAEEGAEKARKETEEVRNELKTKTDELTREIESIKRHCKVLEIKVE